MTEVRPPVPTVVVTGGGQGLGRAFCVSLAKRGHRVAVADINKANAENVAAEIEELGGIAAAFSVDVADEQSVAELAVSVVNDLGPVFGLVNNAALFSTLEMGPFENISLATWESVLKVNVTGTFLCCREFVPIMAERGYGKIVNVSSATIFTGRPNYLHYVTSKAALVGLTRSLSVEVGGRGIRVNALAPGSTKTEIARATITDEARRAMAAQSALGQIQRVEDLVGTVGFLMSRDSDFITGQTINVDGGVAFH